MVKFYDTVTKMRVRKTNKVSTTQQETRKPKRTDHSTLIFLGFVFRSDIGEQQT